jgi:histidinol-phosphate/aromatic aminotransferase/cobyric acid decarboxylase-like protein
LIPQPSFGEYKATFPRHYTYPDDGQICVEDIANEAGDADIVVFVTPNNPTGTTLDAAKILAFARRHPGKTILADESFLAFHTAELCGAASLVRLLEQEPLANVHVICSLSKTLGMPGLRLGYVYSRSAQFLRDLGDYLPIWNLNSVAEFLMEISLKHRASIDWSFRATAEDRDLFRDRLLSLDCVESVWPSRGNFLPVQFRWSAERGKSEAARLLSDHSIYIKQSPSFDEAWKYREHAFPIEQVEFDICHIVHNQDPAAKMITSLQLIHKILHQPAHSACEHQVGGIRTAGPHHHLLNIE